MNVSQEVSSAMQNMQSADSESSFAIAKAKAEFTIENTIEVSTDDDMKQYCELLLQVVDMSVYLRAPLVDGISAEAVAQSLGSLIGKMLTDCYALFDDLNESLKKLDRSSVNKWLSCLTEALQNALDQKKTAEAAAAKQRDAAVKQAVGQIGQALLSMALGVGATVMAAKAFATQQQVEVHTTALKAERAQPGGGDPHRISELEGAIAQCNARSAFFNSVSTVFNTYAGITGLADAAGKLAAAPDEEQAAILNAEAQLKGQYATLLSTLGGSFQDNGKTVLQNLQGAIDALKQIMQAMQQCNIAERN